MKASKVLKASLAQLAYLRIGSCLHCRPCPSSCTVVDNRLRFVFDPEQKAFSHMEFDPTPRACLGSCGKACMAELRLIDTLRLDCQKATASKRMKQN